MTKKEYLSQAFEINREIESLMMQIEKLNSLATRASATLSDMPKGTPSNDRLENIVIRIIELKDEAAKAAEELMDKRKEVRSAIDAVSNSESRTILALRYLSFMKWEEISETMNYSLDYVYQLHRKALSYIHIPV